MTFETALETALDCTIGPGGSFGIPTYKQLDIVYITTDYAIVTNANYVRTPYRVENLVMKWDGTKILDSTLTTQANATGTAGASMHFYQIRNEGGAKQIRHQSELILIAAVRTNVGTDVTTKWTDAFTAS